MIGSVNGAHGFAWSIFAVLAHYRNKSGLDIRVISFPITFNPYPRHGPGTFKPFLRIYWYVIF
jgi:hypothetical protein